MRRALLAAGLLVPGVVLLLAFSAPLPSGADPGNLVFEGRLLLAGDLAATRYPPLLPAMTALALLVAGDAWTVGQAMRVLPASLLVLAGAAAWWAARAVGADARGAALAFALGAANPVLAFELTWGGYPQALAIALALAAVAAHLDRRAPWALSPALFALAALANPYPPAFALVALLALLAADRGLRRPGREAALAVALAAGLALPTLAIYVRLARLLKPASAVVDLGPRATLLALPAQAATMGWGVLVLLGILGLALVALRGRRRIAFGAAIGSVLVVAAGLQFATFMNLSGRSVYLLSALVPVAAGAALAARGPPGALAVVVAALVVVASAGASVAAAHAGFTHYRVDAAEIRASADELATAPPGAVVVHGDQPTTDAWWLRGLTMRHVLSGGPLWEQLFTDGWADSRLAHEIRHGRAGLLGERADLLTGGCAGEGLTLALVTGFSYHHVLAIPDADVRVAGAPLVGAWRTNVSAAEIIEEDGNATRTLTALADGFRVVLTGAGGPVAAVAWAPAGARWIDVEAGAQRLTAVVETSATGRRIPFALDAPGAAIAVDAAGHWASLQSDGPTLTIEILLEGAAGARPVDLAAAAVAAGAPLVYARDGDPRWARDPALAHVASPAPDTDIYRVAGSAADWPCRAPPS